MKKICISKNWHLDAPHFHGFVDLPNDYAVTAPRDPDAPGRGDNGYFVCGSSRYVKNLDIAGKKGGLFVAPTHLLEPDVPVENVVAYIKACAEYTSR